MSNKSAPLPPADQVQAFGHAVGEIWRSMQGLSMPLPELNALQSDYLKQATALWNGAVEHASGDKPAAARWRAIARTRTTWCRSRSRGR